MHQTSSALFVAHLSCSLMLHHGTTDSEYGADRKAFKNMLHSQLLLDVSANHFRVLTTTSTTSNHFTNCFTSSGRRISWQRLSDGTIIKTCSALGRSRASIRVLKVTACRLAASIDSPRKLPRIRPSEVSVIVFLEDHRTGTRCHLRRQPHASASARGLAFQT